MSVTDSSTNKIPIPILKVTFSPNTKTPTQSADTGSNAPKIAVCVDPMFLTATANNNNDNSPGNNAKIMA